LSARDAARFGLLFARNGLWGDERILSEHWVQRSTALYSIDGDPEVARLGYGFMWWVFLDDRFEPHGAYTALGVGNQAIAVFPELDLVIVNRANTYEGEGTPAPALMNLMEEIIRARTGSPVPEPDLLPLEPATAAGDPMTKVPTARLAELEGSWDFPAPSLGIPTYTTIDLEAKDGHLSSFSTVSGTFLLYLQDDGTLLEEDSYRVYYPIRDEDGAFDGLAGAESIAIAAVLAAAGGDAALAQSRLLLVEADESVSVGAARAVVTLLDGDAAAADDAVRDLAGQADASRVEAEVNGMGYALLQTGHPEQALAVFELNTRVFPDAFNTWDSLGEAYMELGRDEEAIASYERSLALNPENENAVLMIERIREGTTP
jgi:tetratricopeptide (TPR) repeat protein